MENKTFFTYKKGTADLSILFTDRSVGNIVSRVWLFGFYENGDIKTSSQTNPSIDFPQAGIFEVSLSIEYSNGEKQTYIEDIIAGYTFDIKSLVQSIIPFEIEDALFKTFLHKWQLYLFPATQYVLKADVFLETSWPANFNILISKLILYDLLIMKASNIIQTSTTGKGGTKKIETGPANVEWFDPSALWANAFKGTNNLIQLLIDDLCIYARKVGVVLPMCKIINGSSLFIIARPKTRKRHGYFGNGFLGF